MKENGFKSTCKTNKNYVEMLAKSFVDEWIESFDKPEVFNGEIDSLEYPTVVAWGTLIEAQGYRMQYDPEKECFWLINKRSTTDIKPIYY